MRAVTREVTLLKQQQPSRRKVCVLPRKASIPACFIQIDNNKYIDNSGNANTLVHTLYIYIDMCICVSS